MEEGGLLDWRRGGAATCSSEGAIGKAESQLGATAAPWLAAAEAAVRTYQDLLMREHYDATEPCFTPALVKELTGAGRQPFGEMQRRRARLIGGLSDYRIVAARQRLGSCPAEALVDVDSFWGGIKWEETIVLVNGPDGWRIAGAFWRNALG